MMDRHRRTAADGPGDPDDEEEDVSPVYRRPSTSSAHCHRRRLPNDDCIRMDQGEGVDDIVTTDPSVLIGATGGGDGGEEDFFCGSDEEPDEEDLEDVEEEDEDDDDQLDVGGQVVVVTTAGGGSEEPTEEQPDEDLPYPGFVPITLGFLTQTSRPRALCLRMITNPYPFSRNPSRVLF